MSAPKSMGRSRYGVVDDQRNAVTMREFRQSFDIGHGRARVDDAFGVDGFGVGADGRFDGGKIVDVLNEITVDAELREEVAQRVHRCAVQVDRCDDPAAAFARAHQRVADRRHAGRDGDRTDAVFQRGDATFQRIDGRIGDSGVFEARYRTTRERVATLGVLQVERRGGVDGNAYCVGVGLSVVSGVDGFGFEAQ